MAEVFRNDTDKYQEFDTPVGTVGLQPGEAVVVDRYGDLVPAPEPEPEPAPKPKAAKPKAAAAKKK
jgi:hypothetical protein